MIRNDARKLETAMKRAAGLEVGNDPEKAGSTPAAPRQNANSAGNGDQENLLANYGTSEGPGRAGTSGAAGSMRPSAKPERPKAWDWKNCPP